MSNQRQNGFIGAILIAITAFLIMVGPALYVYGTQKDVTFTVNKAERVNDKQGSKYLVFTDKGVFENTDSILRWKFDSADVYNYVVNEETYNCDSYGWRIPFLSVYPNIVSCERIEK